ncbi:molybdopterin-dependent oxidoreductase [Albimonas sp. CAU 1670]|uniref:molybdopterin-containing oxidoreductase family protein n=1 Tax=Albimonas sp. CAU 1670 TaxID=3032599 RepID=UPI0023DAC774|nr:molybdopterin-dependent oxidoreductase [Albimonas sp. CAU 1670]MDF2234791.1 molybdopterin-dependent oxidoreductase [Albimonas sp. CAU 1670]
MALDGSARLRVPTFCALCTSRCGAVATVEGGRLTALAADPSHPTGQALCLKGKVAPELVESPRRLLHPMKRTRPKGDPDPGWERISWDEALELAATRLNALAAEHGPETVAFNTVSPSTSALSDSRHWVVRLRRAFGSPNHSTSYELCGWGRWMGNLLSWGSALPAGVMPDMERAGCILLWGYNPTVSRIAHATAAVAAVRRGAKLVVVDPRNAGLARRADEWLRVRPGTDGALALGLAHVLIRDGLYDAGFLRAWTNAPALVREDDGRLLRAGDLAGGADDPAQDPGALLAWSEAAGAPVPCRLGEADPALALAGRFEVATPAGPVACRPVFARWAELCARHDPAETERLTDIPAEQVERTAALIHQARPLAYMTWSGLEQQSNANQAALAIGLLYALTGDYDAPGGNVELPVVPAADVQGAEFLSAEQRAKTVGRETRPLGPAAYEEANSADVYRAILEGEPYRIRGLVSFGSNLLMAHADGDAGAKALAALEFHVHVDHTPNPSADFADLLLPAATPFETEGLKIGFEISAEANGLVQLRRPLVEPRGESRADARIVFDLACALGLGDRFWDGDLDAGMRAQLAPSGVTLEALRAAPEGVRVPLVQRHRKYAEPGPDAEGPRGFATPSRRVELYSERLLAHGYDPLPVYRPPLVEPRRAPRFPLTLTCAKDTLFCETQHRGVPALRRRQPDPPVDLHPDAAAARGIAAGDWVRIRTPHGQSLARARLDPALAPDVVCGQHGWWEPCEELDAPGYPALGPGNSNFNAMIGHDAVDPVSGSVPLRAYVCEVERLETPPSAG